MKGYIKSASEMGLGSVTIRLQHLEIVKRLHQEWSLQQWGNLGSVYIKCT